MPIPMQKMYQWNSLTVDGRNQWEFREAYDTLLGNADFPAIGTITNILNKGTLVPMKLVSITEPAPLAVRGRVKVLVWQEVLPKTIAERKADIKRRWAKYGRLRRITHIPLPNRTSYPYNY